MSKVTKSVPTPTSDAEQTPQTPDLAASLAALAHAIAQQGMNAPALSAETIAQIVRQSTEAGVNATRGSRQMSDVDYVKHFPRVTLSRRVFQNGYPVQPKGLSRDTVRKVTELRPGTYLNGLVHVVETPDKGIDLRYHNATIEQRRQLDVVGATSFSALVDKIWREQHPE